MSEYAYLYCNSIVSANYLSGMVSGVVVAAPGPINPLKAALGLSVIDSVPGAQCIFFKDVEKKVELKGSKLHTPR